MRWNPYIDLRAERSRAARATCKECGVAIEKGSWRAQAVPILGKPELLHLDCAAQRAPDLAKRKVVDEARDWPPEALAEIARFLPADAHPAPRSYQRTPLTGLSYGKDAYSKPCDYCGVECPGEPGPTHGHAVRAFSLSGEYRFHPVCALELAPGLALRVALEDSERWPAEVKALFKAACEGKVRPTPRSPWRDTAGIPKLHVSPSGRAACRYCREKIGKGELRLGREQLYGMRRSPVYFHVRCFCRSDDFHPKWLELAVVRVDRAEVARGRIEALGAELPPTPEEDDDVPPLLERLLALYDAVPQPAPEEGSEGPRLTENVVEIPRGFFTS
ncbi:MAG: hypothetical protein D6731_24750 [Planctomycetota bacterium]|nr:MAG: hypothetical protein D6731_24750 [Planctomycetota bacterium]